MKNFNPTNELLPVPAYSSHQACTKLHLHNPLFLHAASALPTPSLIAGAVFCHFRSMAFCPHNISEVSSYPYTVIEMESLSFSLNAPECKNLLRQYLRNASILSRDSAYIDIKGSLFLPYYGILPDKRQNHPPLNNHEKW